MSGASPHEVVFRREFLAEPHQRPSSHSSRPPRDEIDVCSVEGEFGRGAKDVDWIPGAASKHGVILTQDTNINRTRAQWELCRTSKVGVFFFKPPKKGWSYWQIVQLVVRWWPELCARAKETKKPFGFYIEPDGRRMKPL